MTETRRHQTDSAPTSHSPSLHMLSTNLGGESDKTRRCPVAISVKTCSSVTEEMQLVKQLSIKQALILTRVLTF